MNIVNLKWQKSTTDLGVPLHTYNMPHANSVVCCKLVNVGTRDEKWPEEAGLTHALEHMVFQGTENFPDSQTLGAYIENIGGDINAMTGHEKTCFYVYVPANEIERAIHVLSQMMMRPLLPESKIKTEMDAIIEETHMHNDEPRDRTLILARNKVYGEHPLGREISGTEESVLNFKLSDFCRFHRYYYHASNLNFIVVGRLPQNGVDVVTKLFSKHFFGIEKGSSTSREVNLKTDGRLLFCQEKKDIKQVCIVLAAPIYHGTSKEEHDILSLFSEMIGGGSSFPLFVEVRDKLGLCYEIFSHNDRQSDLSSFLIYTGTKPDRFKEAISKIFDIINISKTDSTLLERAKLMLLGQLAISFDNPLQVTIAATRDIVLSGKARDQEEIAEIVTGITIDDINRVATKYLNRDNFTKVFLTPEDVVITEADLSAV